MKILSLPSSARLVDNAQAAKQRARLASERLSSGSKNDRPTEDSHAFFRSGDLFRQEQALEKQIRDTLLAKTATHSAIEAVGSIRSLIKQIIGQLTQAKANLSKPAMLESIGQSVETTLQQIAVYTSDDNTAGFRLLIREGELIRVRSASEPSVIVNGVNFLQTVFTNQWFDQSGQLLPANVATQFATAQGTFRFALANGLETLQNDGNGREALDNLILELKQADANAEVIEKRFAYEYQNLLQLSQHLEVKLQPAIADGYAELRQIDEVYETTQVTRSQLLQDATIRSLTTNKEQFSLLLSLLSV